MKFKDKEKEYISKIIEYIESRGGSLIKECKGGSVYYALGNIKCIRISDHISLKYDIDKIDIILKENKFICIYYRDIKIYENILEVNQWINDMNFSIGLFLIHLEDNVDKEVARLQKESNSRQSKIDQLNKEIKELKKQIDTDKKLINKLNGQLEDKTNKLLNASKYHNRCQELESDNKKLLDKIELLEIQLIKEKE